MDRSRRLCSYSFKESHRPFSISRLNLWAPGFLGDHDLGCKLSDSLLVHARGRKFWRSQSVKGSLADWDEMQQSQSFSLIFCTEQQFSANWRNFFATSVWLVCANHCTAYMLTGGWEWFEVCVNCGEWWHNLGYRCHSKRLNRATFTLLFRGNFNKKTASPFVLVYVFFLLLSLN